MKDKRKKTPSEPAEGQFDGGKIEGRLTADEAKAFAAYMRDRFLTNKSDVLRSALAQFLVREGYLENPAKPEKRGDDQKSAKKSIVRSWQRVARRLAAIIAIASMTALSTVRGGTSPHTQGMYCPVRIATGSARKDDSYASASSDIDLRGRVEEFARNVSEWFFDLEPTCQAAIVATASIMVDLTDGKLSLLGGLQLW